MKKMKSKQWMGAVLVALGLVALIISYSIKGRVGEEMGQVRSIISPLSHTGEGGRTASRMIENQATGEAAGYLQTAQFLMVGGIVLIVAGGVTIFLYKKK